MKKLKILLQHNIFYYVVLFISLFLYLLFSNVPHISAYNSFDNESFRITGITYYDYGIKFNLKGKEKVLGYIYDENFNYNDYSIGDKVLITGKAKDIANNTVPNTFNYKQYLYSNRIYNVVVIDKIQKVSSNNNVLYSMKNILIKRSEKLTKSYPYLKGLIFGINSYIDNDVKDSYRDNGISHLFAISGLHISLFMLVLSKILNKLKVNMIFKSIIMILFLFFYMFLTSFAISVMRCSIFTILLLLNKLFKLEIKTVNLLLLTLSIILFINPLSLNNIGLQYSFLVTFSLIKYSYLLKGNKLFVLFKTSLIAFLVSFPITVNNFYQVNFLSIFYNLLFVPYVSFILFPAILISYILPVLDEFLFLLIKVIENLSHFFEGIDFSKLIFCKMNTFFVMLYYVILCQMLKNNNVKRKLYIFTFLVLLVICYLMPVFKEDYVMYMDVGQGDSIIISVNNVVTMIDTGGIVTYGNSVYEYSLSKNRILPYLKSKGIRKIDNLVLSHGDFDHMGEAKYLVENFKVDKVIFNCGPHNDLEEDLIKALDKKKIEYQSCIDSLNIDDVNLRFLQTKEYDNENDNSNVIYTEINNKKFLFMGDAGSDKELDILEKYNLKDIDVLKVGHHGSNTSSSKEFIEKVNPNYSIISVGKNNRYGHPNKEVLNILDESKIYRTDEDGSIMFKIKNNKLQIETCSP